MPAKQRSRSKSKTAPKRRRRTKSIEMPRRRSASRSQSRTQKTKAPAASARRGSTARAPTPPSVLSPTPEQKRRVQYILPENIQNLGKYHSSSSDSSLISRYVLTPYWLAVVNLLPRWVAPNLLTFAGFVVGMSGPLVLLAYQALGGDFEHAEYPSWVWLYCAFTFFFYQTMDAIDGKQARRIKCSSPLGEILDHGFDAMLTQFFQIAVVIMMRVPPWMGSLYLLETAFALFFTIWEQYHTDLFVLGYISGPVEGILLAILQFILTFIYGREFWGRSPFGVYNVKVPEQMMKDFHVTFGIKPMERMDVIPIGSLRSLIIITFTFGWLYTLLSSTLRVYKAAAKFRATLYTFLPMVLPIVGHVYLYSCYPEIHDAFFPWFELSLGTLITVSSVKMCVSRLTRSWYNPFHAFYFSYILFHCGFLALHVIRPTLSVQNKVGVLMMFLTTVGFLCYIHFMYSVSMQVKAFLKIRIFTVPKSRSKN